MNASATGAGNAFKSSDTARMRIAYESKLKELKGCSMAVVVRDDTLMSGKTGFRGLNRTMTLGAGGKPEQCFAKDSNSGSTFGRHR